MRIGGQRLTATTSLTLTGLLPPQAPAINPEDDDSGDFKFGSDDDNHDDSLDYNALNRRH
jgi:hypothetical protein